MSLQENKKIHDAIGERYEAENYLSNHAKDTKSEWAYVLALCHRRYPIGLGVLDSFLSGPDIKGRIDLVEREAKQNEWLKLELKDTLGLDQSKDWTSEDCDRWKRQSRQEA